jgi:hypothetical protein
MASAERTPGQPSGRALCRPISGMGWTATVATIAPMIVLKEINARAWQ